MKILFTILPLALLVFPADTWEREAQKTGERTFIAQPELLQQIDLTELEIFGPVIMSVARDGGIALYDYATFKGYFLPPENYSSPVTIGDGKGGGPREFGNPTDIAFDDDGNIWIADTRQGRISVWDRNGNLLQTINPAPRRPHRITVTKNRCIVFGMGGDQSLFKIMDTQGNKIKNIENIGSDAVGWVMKYEGSLTSESDAFIYTGVWYGIIRKYNEDGELVYSRGTVEPVGPAELEYRNVDGTRIVLAPRDVPISTLSSTIANDNLYLLSIDNKDRKTRLIDVYELSAGDYRYSIPLPERTRSFGIVGDLLYSLEEREEEPFYVISVYRFKNKINGQKK